MAKWIDKAGLSGDQLADGDKMLLGDVSEAVGSRDKTVTLSDLRAFLGVGVTVGVTQASHGLTVGQAIRHDGSVYVAANAATEPAARVVGIVTSVPDANTFTYQSTGFVTGLAGLTPGQTYYLQDDGSLDTTPGTVEKPVLIAVSATAAVLILAISGGGGPVAAEDVTYDNGTSGLTAEDVQNAIDEVYAAVVAGGIPAAQGLVVVQHGDDDSVPRPTAAVVLWRGSATPDNAVDGDLWDDDESWDS